MKYKSKYSPNAEITAAQYIAELVCTNRAENLQTSLPIKFWELKEWRGFFIAQLKYVNKLLKSFSEKAIISTIRKKKIWTLKPEWVKEEIRKNAKSLAKEKRTETNTKIKPVTVSSKGRVIKKQRLTDLYD